jgi:hypothetical protein
MDRRRWLTSAGGGLGGIALAHLLATEGLLAIPSSAPSSSGLHHPARARRVIQLFMNGGVSQMDTFDYKPELLKRHGEKFDPGTGERIEAATSTPGNLMKPPFEFRQHGECGRWVSSVFPHLAGCVDDLAFLLAMASKTNVHGPASYMMNTGFLLPGFPCLGAWLSYGLGRISDDLPSFVVLPDARGLPYNAKGNFTAGFLPAAHQGTIIRADVPEPLPDLFPSDKPSFVTLESEREGLALLERANRRYAADRPDDTRLDSRISAYELAARMQLSAPEAFDLSAETELARRQYGLDDKTTEPFGRRCLLARRLIERGVRFVQVWSGANGPSNNWDNHNDIPNELPAIARQVDLPIAGLLADLKARGLAEDTLVVFSSEFGRMPFTQGATGRDHNGGTGIAWLAGAGIKGGTAYGESDPWSWRAAQGRTWCYDLHATILHLLGIDHSRLVFRHSGRDFRITDVHGEVVEAVLS